MSKDQRSCLQKGTGGFTLLDILVCLAVVAILVCIAYPIHLHAVDRAKAVEATEALSEVARLERLRYMEQGTYTANLQELGFQLTSSLKYFELFIQVQQDAKGWGYMAFAMPLGANTSDAGWAIAQYAGGKSQISLPGTALKGAGTSACSIWSGWASMEGGRIEGEESISSSSSSTGGGGSPCGGKRSVTHAKK